MEEQWVPVEPRMPCPVCGRIKWCMIHRTGRKVICPSTPSPEFYSNKSGEKNYVHRISGQQALEVKAIVDKIPVYVRSGVDFDRIMKRIMDQTTGLHIDQLCMSLGPNFTRQDADMYSVGWDGKSWCMPMQNGADKWTGVQRRFPDGGKRFIKESLGGVFVPMGPVDSKVWICEGFSDTLASYTAGYYSIGRVSAKTCYEEAVRFVKTHTHVDEVYIVADQDDAGMQGAMTLRTILLGIEDLNECSIVIPGEYNDVRSMFNAEGKVEYKPYVV